LISQHSKQVFCRLFARVSLVFAVLILFGGLGSLLSTLSRSPFSLDAQGVGGVFVGALPRLAVPLLPLSALVALLWWGGELLGTRSWLGWRTAGHGGRSFLAPVGAFAVSVALVTGLFASLFVERGDSLRDRALWEGATPRAGLAVQLDDLMLLPREVKDGLLYDVSFSWGQPPVFGQAEQVELDKIAPRLTLRNGVFRHPELGANLSFSSLELPLAPQVLSRQYVGAKGKAEAMKCWVWPLMTVSLLLGSLPLVLQGSLPSVFGLWFGSWGLIRLGDHQVISWGPFISVLLPLVFSLGVSVWLWHRWEDA
jgi:hypothetical protein